jgi:cytidylate kinase
MPSRAIKTADKEVGRPPVIVVSGQPGSGKSTIARRLAEKLGLRYLYTGEIFRSIARARGMSLTELSRLAERDASIDLEIDRRTIEEALKGGVVIDSHLAGWVLAGLADFSVYLKAPLRVRIERIARREKMDPEEAAADILGRESSQWRRFRSLYSIDTTDLSVFDLVIETSHYKPDEIIELIIKALPRDIIKRTGE